MTRPGSSTFLPNVHGPVSTMIQFPLAPPCNDTAPCRNPGGGRESAASRRRSRTSLRPRRTSLGICNRRLDEGGAVSGRPIRLREVLEVPALLVTSQAADGAVQPAIVGPAVGDDGINVRQITAHLVVDLVVIAPVDKALKAVPVPGAASGSNDFVEVGVAAENGIRRMARVIKNLPPLVASADDGVSGEWSAAAVDADPTATQRASAVQAARRLKLKAVRFIILPSRGRPMQPMEKTLRTGRAAVVHVADRRTVTPLTLRQGPPAVG